MTPQPPRSWLSRLARRMGLSPLPADVAESLAGLQAAVTVLAEAQAESRAGLEALRQAVGGLEKQLARVGKEQFKANTLAESQQKNLRTMFEQLREAEAYRERELASLRERLVAARGEGRLEVVKSLLPVLDGLAEALASGERVLKNHASNSKPQSPKSSGPTPGPSAQRLRFAGRVRRAAEALFGAARAAPVGAAETLSPEAVAAWLEGLTFVQNRLLAILAAEGVHPIEAEGEAFDPHRHVAVETVPAVGDLASGTVVRETRRGYAMGDTVLRYAEVVAAK